MLNRLAPSTYFGVGAAALVYLFFLGQGGDSLAGALVISAVWAGFAALALTQTWARIALDRGGVMLAPGIALCLVFLVGLWSISPWIPGGAHPAWSYVPSATPAASLSRSLTIGRLVALGGLACTFLVGFALGRRDGSARMTADALVAGGAAYAVLSLILWGSHLAAEPRLTGAFDSANLAATVFAALMPLAVSRALSAHRRRTGRKSSAPLYWAAAALFGVCLMLSASRGGSLAACAGVAVLFGLEALAGRFDRRALIAVAAGGVALLLADGAALLLRASSLSAAADPRHVMFGVYWRAFLDSPLFGYGLGAFDEINKLLLTPRLYGSLWDVRAAHNVYLQWLMEAGLIGAAPMFAAVALVLGLTWRGLQRRKRSTTLIRGLLAVDVVVLAHGWTDFSLQLQSIAVLWALMLGLQLGLAHGASDQR